MGNGSGRWGRWATVLGLALSSAAAQASSGASPTVSIYSCTLPDGRRVTSDRPIRECLAREQRVLNRDGSLRAVQPPASTPEERAAAEARERQRQAERLARQDAARRDRLLVQRYPDEATHRKARETALDTVRLAMGRSQQRLRALAEERRPLLDEAEFYRGKALPAPLQLQLEANDAAVQAQREAMASQEAELARINRLYDAELERLRRLWAGATPGTTAGSSSREPALNQASSSRAR